MGRWDKVVDLARRSPANVRFADLCGLLEQLGFVKRRQKGSHRIYRHGSHGKIPLVNLQETTGGKAKIYKVRQVLALIDTYGLEIPK